MSYDKTTFLSTNEKWRPLEQMTIDPLVWIQCALLSSCVYVHNVAIWFNSILCCPKVVLASRTSVILCLCSKGWLMLANFAGVLEQKTGNETTSKLTSIFCAYRLSVGTGFIIELVFIAGVRPDGPLQQKKCVLQEQSNIPYFMQQCRSEAELRCGHISVHLLTL